MAYLEKGRVHVFGTYKHYNAYTLFSMDKTEFMTIRENVPFRIGNKIFVPIKEKIKGKKGTRLVCKEFNEKNKLISYFYLENNMDGLWAVTEEQAKEGVYIPYIRPHSLLENFLDANGISINIIKKSNLLDNELELGGSFCNHVTKKYWKDVLSDGRVIELTQPKRVKHCKFNKEHINCIKSTYLSKITDATYYIYFVLYNKLPSKNDNVYMHIKEIVLTKEADENIIIQQIQDMLGY